MLDELDGITPLDAIGAALGVSRERARQIEQVALRKVAIALAIREQLGTARAHEVWLELSGRPLGDFVQALDDARAARC